MSDPLGYFLTWTTYGSWLPGDERGWIRQGEFLIQGAQRKYVELNQERLVQDSVRLSNDERKAVERAIEEHSRHRGWELQALYVGLAHVHVVVAASAPPEKVLREFKIRCSRNLNQIGPDSSRKERWWSRHGSTRWLNDETSLEAAILYVREGQ